jgi:SAM-dependent methyltransferase
MAKVEVFSRSKSNRADVQELRGYWETHIHDSSLSANEMGSKEFFHDLEEYHYEKLSYLPALVNFAAYRGRRVLEVGCGLGIDLVRFAAAGAIATGIDISSRSIELAKKNFLQRGLQADLRVMNGENLAFPANSFDVVYAHGVVQYTRNPAQMVREIGKVLTPGGEAIITVYNKYSWLNFLAVVMRVKLEHQDAPAFKKYSCREFRDMLSDFAKVQIVIERFPVKSRLQRGLKARLYNEVFVGLFNTIPRKLMAPFGWHLVAKAIK